MPATDGIIIKGFRISIIFTAHCLRLKQFYTLRHSVNKILLGHCRFKCSNIARDYFSDRLNLIVIFLQSFRPIPYTNLAIDRVEINKNCKVNRIYVYDYFGGIGYTSNLRNS